MQQVGDAYQSERDKWSTGQPTLWERIEATVRR
jgi:hypothetical protein